MKKSCQYCGRIHERSYDCGKRPKRQKRGTREAERIRNTARWRRTREQIKQRDFWLCRWCLAKGIINHEGLEVHHIVPIEQCIDLAFEDSNLITLCGRCHELAERGEINAIALSEMCGVPPGGVLE